LVLPEQALPRVMNLRQAGRMLGRNALQMRALFRQLGWMEQDSRDQPTALAVDEGLLAPTRPGPRPSSSRPRFVRANLRQALSARGYAPDPVELEYVRKVGDRLLVELRAAKATSPATP